MAVYLLRLLPAYASSSLIRTRDPAKLATCHTVVDVGGEYDPSTNRFDHHQRSFNDTFPGHETKLSSAGLVYMHFGKAVIAQHIGLTTDHDDVQTLYEKIYTDFIESLDAHDNGISVYDPKAIAASGLQKRFRDGGITLGSIIGDMNNSYPTEDPDEDASFAQASTLIGECFLRKLRSANCSWLPARETVAKAYKSRLEIHPSGQIISLPKSGVPWKEHLFTLEPKDIDSTKAADGLVYYVLYPESTATDANWRVQCVPIHDSSFESRKPLPDRWRGLRDSELDAVLLRETENNATETVPNGAVFVHASGFIGGHKTKAGALAMAIKSLNNAQ